MSQKILVLDDDADILDIVSLILTESGYEVSTLSSGEQVFEEIQKFHPDLVLMDVMLAGLDGRVICEQIKDKLETMHLPVILISGTHDLADALNNKGAPNDFVAKPFDIDYLLKKIKAHLSVALEM